MAGSGNFGIWGSAGLKPKPPYVGSNCSARAAWPASAISGVSGTWMPGAVGLGGASDEVRQLVGGAVDLLALVAPGVGDPVEHFRERRQAVLRLGGEVRSAEERFAVGSQEHRHRPAASGPEGLQGRHVDLVHVGPFLAIDLDADEFLVHQTGDLGVLEALPLHDVAPEARAVADRQEDRPVLGLRPGERLGAPGIPVHRVMGVEQQVGARLLRETVGVGRLLGAGLCLGLRRRPIRVEGAGDPPGQHANDQGQDQPDPRDPAPSAPRVECLMRHRPAISSILGPGPPLAAPPDCSRQPPSGPTAPDP